MSTRFGYARADGSGGEVALARQRAVVVAAGVAPERVFEDIASDTAGADVRPGLASLLGRLRDGDEVVATSIDRIARGPRELADVRSLLQLRGAVLRTVDDEPSRSLMTAAKTH